MPDRIQLKRTKGWRKPADAVIVTRPGMWGNDWRAGAVDHLVDPYGRVYGEPVRLTRLDAVANFAITRWHAPGWRVLAERNLAGHDLACWCEPPVDGGPDVCHGYVWLCIANGWDMPDWLVQAVKAQMEASGV